MKYITESTLIITVDFCLLRKVLNTILNFSDELQIEVEILPEQKKEG